MQRIVRKEAKRLNAIALIGKEKMDYGFIKIQMENGKFKNRRIKQMEVKMEEVHRHKYFSIIKSRDYKLREGYIDGFSIHFNHHLGLKTTFRKTLNGAIKYGKNKTKNIRDLKNFKFDLRVKEELQ